MKMHRRTTLAAVAAGALALAVLAGWRLAAGPVVEAYAVERQDLLQAVVASGRVQSPRRVEIASSITGTVKSVPVAEGQAVGAGLLLVELDASEAQAAVDQARFALAQAEAKVEQVRSTSLRLAEEALRQAQFNYDNVERTLERDRGLFEKGFLGQAALDDAQRSRDVAKSQVESARLQRESVRPGGAEDRLAKAALAQARANVRAAEARLELMTIEAPVAGRLISRDVEVGNVVQPGKTLMQLSPAGETQLVVQIDEKNLALLRVGQAALASADAYPAQRFAAEVAYINPGIDPLRGSVEVKLAVRDPPAYLLQDMTVSVDIEVSRLAGALAIPADALRDGDWVLVVRGGHARRQAVKVGARGQGRVQVLEGLAEGELVLPVALPGAAEGKSLRAEVRVPRAARRT
ncbi:MAG TPA: efflux RND transporter periplasmic adaptor subunit [Usitatibacter sp.]|nr:efflux RND transporter periplasmic adaptor subunit [Usitatibacter sp.]